MSHVCTFPFAPHGSCRASSCHVFDPKRTVPTPPERSAAYCGEFVP